MGWGEQIPWSVALAALSGWPDLPVGLTTHVGSLLVPTIYVGSPQVPLPTWVSHTPQTLANPEMVHPEHPLPPVGTLRDSKIRGRIKHQTCSQGWDEMRS